MFVRAGAISSARLVFKFECNGFLYRYSTTVATDTTYLVNYLINSFGFSNEQAVSASAKVRSRVKNPHLAVNFLKHTGFKDTHIKILVSKHPQVLSCDVEKTLKPILNCLSQLGLCGSDLIKVILRDWTFFNRGLDTHIKPLINHLKNVLGSDENVVKVIKNKFGIFKSFGWSDTDILTILQKLPHCVALSGARIQAALTFFMKEVRYKSIYIASHPSLLTYSLEKRVIPRYGIWKLANEKNLIKSRYEFYTVLTWSESKFLEKYVLPVKAELPHLYDLYIKRIGK
ncbi:unnamed protein product [Withania somnifera]